MGYRFNFFFHLFVGPILKNMGFRVERYYNAIPCTVEYNILDASYNVLYGQTVTNPPGSYNTSCQSGTPAWGEIIVGSTQIRFPIDCCCPIEVWLTCLPSPSFHPFRICMIADPNPGCDYLVTVEI